MHDITGKVRKTSQEEVSPATLLIRHVLLLRCCRASHETRHAARHPLANASLRSRTATLLRTPWPKLHGPTNCPLSARTRATTCALWRTRAGRWCAGSACAATVSSREGQ